MKFKSHRLTFPAVVSGQVERTLTVEFADKIDASCRRRTRILMAVNNVLVTMFACGKKKTRIKQPFFTVGPAVFEYGFSGFRIRILRFSDKNSPVFGYDLSGFLIRILRFSDTTSPVFGHEFSGFRIRILACVSWWADACVSRPVVDARGPVLAGVRFARIVFVLATDSGVVWRARAVESGTEVLALASVHARMPDAPLRRSFTLLAVRSRGTPKQFTSSQKTKLCNGFIALYICELVFPDTFRRLSTHSDSGAMHKALNVT